MTRIVVILLGCAVLVGAARATYTVPTDARAEYVVCADQRVTSFGFGQRSAPMAELAAIVRWMSEATELGQGYDNWALAQDRWMQCQKAGGTGYLHCRAAAVPCRPKDT